MSVSRRGFLGLVGGFAAVSALPGPFGGVGPAALPKTIFELDPAGWTRVSLIDEHKKRTSSNQLTPFVYGLPYWQVDAHSGTYAGLERSALPVFPPEKRFRK